MYVMCLLAIASQISTFSVGSLAALTSQIELPNLNYYTGTAQAVNQLPLNAECHKATKLNLTLLKSSKGVT